MSVSLRGQLAPKGLSFNPSDFFISDKYATILSVVSYPRYIQPGYLSTLTSMSGIKIVVKHIPVEFAMISKMLNKQVADLKERYGKERDQTSRERIRQDYESLEYFISMLAASQARIFDFQMHIMITADTKEDLEMKKVNVKNYLDAMELKSILPIFPSQDIEERIGTPIPSVTIAAMYPFIFDSIKDPGLSTLLGVDFSGGVILFNQFLYKIRKENNFVQWGRKMKNVVVDKLTADNVYELYLSVDWSGLYKSQIQQKLANTNHTFTIYEGNRLVGMARIVGNTHTVCYLKDFIIKPEYQHEGYGNFLMNFILNYIKEHNSKDKHSKVCVFSSKGKEKFYEKCGFRFVSGKHSHEELYQIRV